MIESSADARAKAFGDAVREIPSESTTRNDGRARLGMGAALLGVIVTVVGLVLSQTSDNPLDQSTALSLGIVGLALVVLGTAVFLRYSFGQFLRFWLLRLSYELTHRDH